MAAQAPPRRPWHQRRMSVCLSVCLSVCPSVIGSPPTAGAAMMQLSKPAEHIFRRSASDAIGAIVLGRRLAARPLGMFPGATAASACAPMMWLF
jgi:hypothetical protein